MTDYWKSNERKYCDFCKCWISDNKASVAFHESGKRHKLNVAKRISELSRNSEKSERERQKMDMEIRKMEDAAMRSYTMDIHASGDLTARSINAVLNAAQSPTVAASSSYSGPSSSRGRQVDPLRLPGNSDDEEQGGRVSMVKAEQVVVPDASLWVEGKSDDGLTYYWNVKTNESVWVAPKEGYLSWAEYQRINTLALQQQDLQQASEAQHFRDNANEEVARYNRERLKMFRKSETPQEKKDKQERREAYKTEEEAGTQEIGVWQTVETKAPPAAIDWELPETNYYVPPVVIDATPEPPVKRFKEKTVSCLDFHGVSGEPITFKKRKFAAKGNPRQRLDVD